MTLDWLRQLLGLPGGAARPPRGHRLVRPDHRARRRARGRARTGGSSSAPSTRTRPRPRRRGCSSSSVRTTPVDDAYAMRPDALDLTRRLRRRRDGRHDLVDRGRPRRRDRRPRRPRRASGCTSTPPTPARRPSAPSCGTTSPAGSAPTRSASTRTSGCSRRWTARRSSRRRPGRPPARLQPRAGVPARRRGRRQPQRVRLAARPPLPGAEAVGDAALLRPRGAAGDHPRARPPGRRSSRGGSRPSRAGRSCAPRPFSLVCFRTVGSDDGERGAHAARQRQRRDLPLAHEARRPLRAAARDRQRAHDRGRRRARLGRASREARRG